MSRYSDKTAFVFLSTERVPQLLPKTHGHTLQRRRASVNARELEGSFEFRGAGNGESCGRTGSERQTRATRGVLRAAGGKVYDAVIILSLGIHFEISHRSYCTAVLGRASWAACIVTIAKKKHRGKLLEGTWWSLFRDKDFFTGPP